MPKRFKTRLCPHCAAPNTIRARICYKCGNEMPRFLLAEEHMFPQTWVYQFTPTEQRDGERRPLEASACVLLPNGEPLDSVLIQDISPGGLEFVSNSKYVLHDRFGIKLALGGREYRASIIVRRCEQFAFYPWRFAIGAAFDQPDPELLEAIQRLPIPEEPAPKKQKTPA